MEFSPSGIRQSHAAQFFVRSITFELPHRVIVLGSIIIKFIATGLVLKHSQMVA
jgi:hypothetical protein